MHLKEFEDFLYDDNQKLIFNNSNNILGKCYGIKGPHLPSMPSKEEIKVKGIEHCTYELVIKTLNNIGYL